MQQMILRWGGHLPGIANGVSVSPCSIPKHMCRTRLEVSFKKCLFSGWYWTHLGTSAFETTFPPFPLLVDTGSCCITQFIDMHCTPSHMLQQKLSSNCLTTSDDTPLNQPLNTNQTKIDQQVINNILQHWIPPWTNPCQQQQWCSATPEL